VGREKGAIFSVNHKYLCVMSVFVCLVFTNKMSLDLCYYCHDLQKDAQRNISMKENISVLS
jgi:hypothetical protein